MTDVLIEPVPGQRRAFARWSLAQQPGGYWMTNGTTWSLTADAFATVPLELLDGARIDGTLFRPVVEGFEPDGLGYRPVDVVPVQDGPKPEPVKAPLPRRRTRSPRKDTEK